jgi:hypothetical protein
MFTYKNNNYIFNFYDINLEREIIFENNLNNQIDIDSLAVGSCVIPYDSAHSYATLQSDNTHAMVVNCFYSVKQKQNSVIIAESMIEDHINTVTQQVIQHLENYYLPGKTDWNNSHTQLSVLSYQAIPSNNGSMPGIMYSLDTKIMFVTVVRQIPIPLCSNFNNAPIKYYSKDYIYANDAKSPNCSHPTLNANSNGQLVVCPYNVHSQCSFYSKNETEVKLDYFYNKVVDTSPSKYQLVKSYYSDFSVEYTIKIDDVEFTKIRRPYTQEDIISVEEEVIKVYEEVIKTTSSLTSIENFSDNSQSKNSSYLMSLVSSEG